MSGASPGLSFDGDGGARLATSRGGGAAYGDGDGHGFARCYGRRDYSVDLHQSSHGAGRGSGIAHHCGLAGYIDTDGIVRYGECRAGYGPIG